MIPSPPSHGRKNPPKAKAGINEMKKEVTNKNLSREKNTLRYGGGHQIMHISRALKKCYFSGAYKSNNTKWVVV